MDNMVVYSPDFDNISQTELNLFNWMIAYFAQDQSLRMIIRPDKSKTEPKQA
jgi:hypothetical protein